MRFEVVAVLILAFAVHVNCEWYTLWGLLGRTNSIEKELTKLQSTKTSTATNPSATVPSGNTSNTNPATSLNPSLLSTKKTAVSDNSTDLNNIKSSATDTTSNAASPYVNSKKSKINTHVSTTSKDGEKTDTASDTSAVSSTNTLSSPPSTVKLFESDDSNSRRPRKPEDKSDDQSADKPRDRSADNSMPTWKKVTIGLVIAAGSVVVLIIIGSIVKTMRRDSDN